MLDNGGNVVPLAPTIAYAIEDHGRVPAVAWLPEPIPTTIAQALRHLPARSNADEPALAMHECDLWLREMLSAGPVLYAEILTAGRPNGFTRNTLRRAKKRLGEGRAARGSDRDRALLAAQTRKCTLIEQQHRGLIGGIEGIGGRVFGRGWHGVPSMYRRSAR